VVAFFVIISAASALIRGASRAEATPPFAISIGSGTPPGIVGTDPTGSPTTDPLEGLSPTQPVSVLTFLSPTVSITHTASLKASFTPTPGSTFTPTSSATPTPTPTRELNIPINLLLAKNKDDSLFVVNQNETSLPLEPLVLKNDDGGVLGEAWDVSMLREGECVAIWKDTGRPRPPKDVECKIVGKRLEREAGKRFWTANFTIYYDDVEIGSCRSSTDVCRIEYPD
jgi:hypothetical protein